MKFLKNINKTMLALTLIVFSTFNFAEQVTITYIHTDHLGTPIIAWGEDGKVKWKKDYQPFGKQVKDNQPTDSNVGFTGHMQDKTNGLVYMKGRWYHPESSRFMALDPVGFATHNTHSFNRYSYVSNNPYRYIDPDGRDRYEILAARSRSTGESIAKATHCNGCAGAGQMFFPGIGVVDAAKDISAGNYMSAAINATSELPVGKILKTKKYITYTKTNPKTGKVYSGRASGYGKPGQILNNRDRNHHMNKKGFESAELDKVTTNRAASRGREQQLIDANGGAQSMGGTSGNAINGIAKKSPRRQQYLDAANKEF